MPYVTTPQEHVAQSDPVNELLEAVAIGNGPILVRQVLETCGIDGWGDLNDKDVISIIKDIIIDSVDVVRVHLLTSNLNT